MRIGLGLPNAAKSLTDGPLLVDIARRADQEAGRGGKPEFRALAYFALGEETCAEAESNVLGYYGEYGPRVWQGTIKTADEAKPRVKAYEAIGCDELILFMTAPAVEQAERLAEAVL